jgi:hypothetical protein
MRIHDIRVYPTTPVDNSIEDGKEVLADESDPAQAAINQVTQEIKRLRDKKKNLQLQRTKDLESLSLQITQKENFRQALRNNLARRKAGRVWK